MGIISTPSPVIRNFTHDTGVLGDHVTSDALPSLLINADAAAVVTVLRDGVEVGTAVQTAIPGVFSFASALLEDGTYSFTAVATTEIGGASLPSATFDITIDHIAPTSPAFTGIAADSGTAGDHVTNDTAPTLQLTAEAGSTITIYQDGVEVGVATELSPAGTFIYSTEGLADGTYSFTAKATDPAGNAGELSTAFSVTVDHVAPDVPHITGFADDTAATGDGVTSDNTPTLTITAEHGASVEVFSNGETIGFATETATDGTFTFTPEPMMDGAYSFTAQATDTAGNHSTVSDALALTIDHTAPDVPSIFSFETDTGATDDQLTSDTTPTLTIYAEHGTSVEVFQNGVSVGHATETPESGTFTFESASLADGAYDFTVVATDTAGNASTASDAYSITIDHTAPDAPVIDTVAGGVIDITAEPGATVDVYRDGELIGTALELDSGSYELQDDGYGPGVTYTAVATDAADNVSGTSEPVVSNHAPTITLGGGEVAEVHVDENVADVGIVPATDLEGDAISYAIVGGPDAEAFTIDPDTGMLSLVTPADFETPTDWSGTGTYNLTVEVTDGEFSSQQAIAVVIDDVINERLVGTEDDDRLVAANGDSVIQGMGGNDLLIAGSGNDRLDGGEGADTMIGGAGNDVYYVDNSDDKVVETTTAYGATLDSGGKDTIYATVSYDMGAAPTPVNLGAPRGGIEAMPAAPAQNSARFVETLVLRGSDNLNGFGNALDNRMIGNDGINHLMGRNGNDVMSGGASNDKLEGGAGNDKLIGGDGNDRLIGGTGKDTFVFDTALNASTNKDIIYDFSHAEGDRIQLSSSVFNALGVGKLSADAFYAADGAKAAHDATDHIIYNTATGALYYDADGAGGQAAVQFATVGIETHPTLSVSDFAIVA